ncbi:hypothetical protein BDF14DRAFT_842557 [Spinellus fusiger]|nr:hypothetical protein BDF14DRAFT_842557 [Spinellus fusiger]
MQQEDSIILHKYTTQKVAIMKHKTQKKSIPCCRFKRKGQAFSKVDNQQSRIGRQENMLFIIVFISLVLFLTSPIQLVLISLSPQNNALKFQTLLEVMYTSTKQFQNISVRFITSVWFIVFIFLACLGDVSIFDQESQAPRKERREKTFFWKLLTLWAMNLWNGFNPKHYYSVS